MANAGAGGLWRQLAVLLATSGAAVAVTDASTGSTLTGYHVLDEVLAEVNVAFIDMLDDVACAGGRNGTQGIAPQPGRKAHLHVSTLRERRQQLL